jgi:hypothetical protein
VASGMLTSSDTWRQNLDPLPKLIWPKVFSMSNRRCRSWNEAITPLWTRSIQSLSLGFFAYSSI